MNSGLGAPSGPGAKSSVARAADMNAYTVAPASATHGTPASPKAEHGRVGVEGTLSAQEGFRAERIHHLRSAFDVFGVTSQSERTRQIRGGEEPEIAQDQRALGNEIVTVPVVLSRRTRTQGTNDVSLQELLVQSGKVRQVLVVGKKFGRRPGPTTRSISSCAFELHVRKEH